MAAFKELREPVVLLPKKINIAAIPCTVNGTRLESRGFSEEKLRSF
jgi:hypothetical protein